jgi:DNA-binding transcriptional LysR family regulator
MDVHLRDLRYFVAVAEELNFTRAARRLHMSQPALSKQIQGLETALHARLLERNRREVKLTGAGDALLASARSLLESWDDITAVVTEATAERSRRSAARSIRASSTSSEHASPAGESSFVHLRGVIPPRACAIAPPTLPSCGCRLMRTTSLTRSWSPNGE